VPINFQKCSRIGRSVVDRDVWSFDLIASAGEAEIDGRDEALLGVNHAWKTIS